MTQFVGPVDARKTADDVCAVPREWQSLSNGRAQEQGNGRENAHREQKSRRTAKPRIGKAQDRRAFAVPPRTSRSVASPGGANRSQNVLVHELARRRRRKVPRDPPSPPLSPQPRPVSPPDRPRPWPESPAIADNSVISLAITDSWTVPTRDRTILRESTGRAAAVLEGSDGGSGPLCCNWAGN